MSNLYRHFSCSRLLNPDWIKRAGGWVAETWSITLGLIRTAAVAEQSSELLSVQRWWLITHGDADLLTRAHSSSSNRADAEPLGVASLLRERWGGRGVSCCCCTVSNLGCVLPLAAWLSLCPPFSPPPRLAPGCPVAWSEPSGAVMMLG